MTATIVALSAVGLLLLGWLLCGIGPREWDEGSSGLLRYVQLAGIVLGAVAIGALILVCPALVGAGLPW